MALQAERGVPLSTLSPKFLHSNSTSHTWPFSAIAELIDNAYDPDVSAKQFWIDKTVVKGEECLTFMDNGNGLDNETMHKMLSFGYSDKAVVNGQQPIGIYGNGFKSGSMRLGKDAIVFSKSKNSSCVGMLSQTYLEKINANQIIVPIVCFEKSKTNQFFVREEHQASLQDILEYSPFKTQQELLNEIDNLISSLFQAKTGTRIIIWNLRRTSSGSTEFDCETDRYDIRIPHEVYDSMNDHSQHSAGVPSYTPDTMFSLRAYCSILYLKPRMQIMVRGQKVKSQLIAKSLAHVKKDFYKPLFLDNKPIKIIFGYNPKNKDQYGIMMYHKNRLIKAYERVGCQLKADRKGVGVIGVIPCDFLEPTHNKQSFLESDKYRKTMNNLAIKLEEYCLEIRYRKNKENPNSTIPVEDTMKRPDQNWVQCDKCLQWRKLPDGIDCTKLPDKWFCHMNPDPQFRSCLVLEEAEDSGDDRPYQKTYKHQEREAKMKLENSRLKAEEDRKSKEAQRLARLSRQTEDLGRQHQNLQQQLRQTTGSSSSTPTTPNTRPLQGSTLRAASSPRIISALPQSVCSPSSNSGLPVISNVCSLSVGPQSGKRTLPVPAQPPKRLRLNGLNRGTSNTPSTANVSSPSSAPVAVLSDDDSDDDVIVVSEKISSPKPKQPVVDCDKVKKESEESEASISMLLECTDDAAVDDPSESNAAGKDSSGSAAVGARPSTALLQHMASSTTQTEVPKIKQEKLSQNPTQGNATTTEGECTKTSTENGLSNLNACDAGEREFKQESNGDTGNRGQLTLQNGNAGLYSKNNCDNTQSPVKYPNVADVQEQQDQLLELMQDTAQERDDLKEKVHQLTCKLNDAERRLDELPNVNIKKECLHQASQTEEEEEEGDYKSLFQKAKQKVDELISDKEALIAEMESRAELSTAQGERDSLIRDLDQSNKEREELRSQVDDLKVQKVDLEKQCEELRKILQQQSEKASTRPTSSESSGQDHQEEEGGMGTSSTNSSTATSTSLIELRHNVGRLLISYVPALDLEQVNYECNVIDEILEQVVSNRDAVSIGDLIENSESQ